MSHLSDRLTSIRKKSSPSPSQAEVAKDLNVAQSTYARFESGTREPPISFIANFCKYFNVSADYVLGLSDTPRPQLIQSEADLPRPDLLHCQPFADPLAKLHHEYRDKAVSYIDYLHQQQLNEMLGSGKEA